MLFDSIRHAVVDLGRSIFFTIVCLAAGSTELAAQEFEPTPVEGQPLGANIERLIKALELLGRPLDADRTRELSEAAAARDSTRLQKTLDPLVLAVVTINPESRVKVERGLLDAELQQAGYTPFVVKVVNQGRTRAALEVDSPQAGPPYSGTAVFSLERQGQTELAKKADNASTTNRFLRVSMFDQPPLTRGLSGLAVEYALVLIHTDEAGEREATIVFDVGQGSQDLGFRAEVPILFRSRPAVRARLSIRDHDRRPCFARLLIRDRAGAIYPPQARRLAPDFFFQPHIYRRGGETVDLPPGEFIVEASRGPEYNVVRSVVRVPEQGECELKFELSRWVEPARRGYFSGDHHIHGAGCAHYTRPTEGVTPEDMFRQTAGEGLNVGCVLTWGPCFEFQREFFLPTAQPVSEPFTLLKYDLEISGFGSQALGHVCLLNLRDQVYPGSDGTKEKGWPTWATPVLRWAKKQGAVVGYAHSASGLQVDPPRAAARLLAEFDTDKSGQLSPTESAMSLLPDSFDALDANNDDLLSEAELTSGAAQGADRLPNLVVPEMNSVGAMELPVSAAHGACDFISSMDTARIPEWNMWYHVMNAGFPLKVSGETDFPCMSSVAVGQGRVYVRLGAVERIDYGDWCRGLRAGRSYVSDGYAHALEFTVEGRESGERVDLPASGAVKVRAVVAFAPETPLSVAYGTRAPEAGPHLVGDTVVLHGSRSFERAVGGARSVELVANGVVVGSQEVPADGAEHVLQFTADIRRSSWVALRQFPQMHTNPVEVIVADRPIRASRASAQWLVATIRQLWSLRAGSVAPGEREAAKRAFDEALEIYRKIAEECPAGT